MAAQHGTDGERMYPWWVVRESAISGRDLSIHLSVHISCASDFQPLANDLRAIEYDQKIPMVDSQ